MTKPYTLQFPFQFIFFSFFVLVMALVIYQAFWRETFAVRVLRDSLVGFFIYMILRAMIVLQRNGD